MASPRLDPEEALIGPVYLVAALLVLLPAVDFVMSVGTPQPGSVQWRFATVGLLSGYTITPILGAAIALVVAGFAGHRLVMAAVSWLSLVGAAILLLLVASFLLDAIQLRLTVPEDGQRAFRSASARALVKHGLSAAAFLYLGWRGRRMIPAVSHERQARPVHIVTK